MAVSEPLSTNEPTAAPSARTRPDIHAARERFIEGMGLALEEDRLPRIAGRLIGLLLLSPRPVRFDHLAQRLRVSRGSISTNTRLLENMGAIERVTRPGDRRDYFQINEAPGLLQRVAERYRSRQAMAAEMKNALLPDEEGTGVVQDRLERLIRFYSILADSLDLVLTTMDGDGRANGDS